jgi:Tol biopolymer transport system component
MPTRSVLCVYSLSSQETTAILTTDTLIEAPNWTPDGKVLLVNGNGQLWRVLLEHPTLQPINTGRLTMLNNDHGISPDGQTLFVTDKTETGKSCIYSLPMAGGSPTRLTAAVPSYYHGCSLDGQTLAYCGFRNDVINIFTTPVAGGSERIITTGPGHKDGPDFTADGQWLWFNGDMGGRMELWRVRTDGTALEAMTDDDTVNWFPHPSPCGKHVLYLAYKQGTEGHPRDQEVELRLLPSDGGVPRTLVQLFGGQGTINVPCWAPDAGQFAFVRYEKS